MRLFQNSGSFVKSFHNVTEEKITTSYAVYNNLKL